MIQNHLIKKYFSYISINQHENSREYAIVAMRAQTFFDDFLNMNEYGNLITTSFNFYVESDVDIDKQHDFIQTTKYQEFPPSARLSLHIDYNLFNNADDEYRFRVLTNGILFLLKYWVANLEVPSNCQLDIIVSDYTKYIKEKGFILSENENEKLFFKITCPFRLDLSLNYNRNTNETEILIDTCKIEKFFNNNIYDLNLGTSVKTVFFHLYLYNNEEKDILAEYYERINKHKLGKRKDLSMDEKFDLSEFLSKDVIGIHSNRNQLKCFHECLLNSINGMKTMKRKPRDFDIDKFCKVVDKLMLEYIELYSF